VRNYFVQCSEKYVWIGIMGVLLLLPTLLLLLLTITCPILPAIISDLMKIV